MPLSTATRLLRYSSQIRNGSPLYKDRRTPVTKKLLVTLIASAFAATAFAQTPKSETAPKAPAATEAKKEAAPAPKAKAKAKSHKTSMAKGEKKAKPAKSKGKAKAKADEAKK
jgi:hypothetical protein